MLGICVRYMCMEVCRPQWPAVFHKWNMDHYRWAPTGDLPECTHGYFPKKRHGQYQSQVRGINLRHCYCHGKQQEFCLLSS